MEQENKKEKTWTIEKKEKEKTSAELEEKIDKEVVFHDMPSSYRSGHHSKNT